MHTPMEDEILLNNKAARGCTSTLSILSDSTAKHAQRRMGELGVDCGLPVKDPKSKTFSIRDENSDVLYMDLREVTQLPEKLLSYWV